MLGSQSSHGIESRTWAARRSGLASLQGTATVDNLFIKLDALIFRTHLTVWIEQFISPGMTEVLSLCYFLHLVMPTVTMLFICLYAKRSLFLEAVQGFNEQLERLAELAVVMVVGAMLFYIEVPHSALWFPPLLFLLVRPVSVWLGLRGAAAVPTKSPLTPLVNPVLSSVLPSKLCPWDVRVPKRSGPEPVAPGPPPPS